MNIVVRGGRRVISLSKSDRRTLDNAAELLRAIGDNAQDEQLAEAAAIAFGKLRTVVKQVLSDDGGEPDGEAPTE